MRVSRQVFPQRARHPDHCLADRDRELAKDLRIAHGIALHEKVVSVPVKARRAAIARVAAEEL
jgi:hypothetical protein